MRTDIYAKITDSIIAELEKGVRPWAKPWNAGNTEGRITRPLRWNFEPYQGINVLMLWGASIEKGYSSPTWMTYKQANDLKGQVRKGEHGEFVVYANRLTRTTKNDQGEDVEQGISFLKAYKVFNTEQIDNLPEKYNFKAAAFEVNTWERNQKVDEFIANTGAEIRHGGGRAYYNRTGDFIQLPPPEAFKDRDDYYSTSLHENIHRTGNEKRLAREFGKRFGDEAYAAEELVAEIGSAFLCADLGVKPGERSDHASYVGNWLKVLKNDNRAIFTAAAHAQRAANFLHDLQSPKPEPTRPEEVLTVRTTSLDS